MSHAQESRWGVYIRISDCLGDYRVLTTEESKHLQAFLLCMIDSALKLGCAPVIRSYLKVRHFKCSLPGHIG